MNEDVDCPYCDAGQMICHDDGYGYEENETFSQECEGCGKTFTYTTTPTYYYDVYKAPCLNGGEHKWKRIIGWPPEHYENKYRCEYCDARTIKETGDCCGFNIEEGDKKMFDCEHYCWKCHRCKLEDTMQPCPENVTCPDR